MKESATREPEGSGVPIVELEPPAPERVHAVAKTVARILVARCLAEREGTRDDHKPPR